MFERETFHGRQHIRTLLIWGEKIFHRGSGVREGTEQKNEGGGRTVGVGGGLL